MSTSFLVIQAQRDLAIARNNELQALLDYQLAVIAFEAVQQTAARTIRVTLHQTDPVWSRQRQRWIVTVLQHQIGDDARRQRRQQDTVAIVAGRVDQTGRSHERPMTGRPSVVAGRSPARASRNVAPQASGSSSQTASRRSRTPAAVVRSSNPTSSTVAPTSSGPVLPWHDVAVLPP